MLTSRFLLFFCLLAAVLAGCGPARAPTPEIALALTSVQPFDTSDFTALHSPTEAPNRCLVFGKLPVTPAAAGLEPELAAFLGRWEGANDSPPVKNDRRVVLVVQEINAGQGKAVAWSGANLQFPDFSVVIHFRVVPGKPPAIEWQMPLSDGRLETVRFTYDSAQQALRGEERLADGGTVLSTYVLKQTSNFYIYQDYTQYLAGKRLTAQRFQDQGLGRYGVGYLLYLPEGYEDQPARQWPLLFFLHGYGDRSDNVLLLAKASPFMYIREQGPLPLIIVAPLLKADDGYPSFPDEYMAGVLAEVQTLYRVDVEHIYLTGLSMGGEAAYRFAVHRPQAFAALAVLSAYVNSQTYARLAALKGLPVWAIHGAQDTVVPLETGQEPVEALKAAGVEVRWTVLEDHDHDTWTTTYADPAFYDWLLAH
jgi:predicted esterase